jgi:hypothetical protein
MNIYLTIIICITIFFLLWYVKRYDLPLRQLSPRRPLVVGGTNSGLGRIASSTGLRPVGSRDRDVVRVEDSHGNAPDGRVELSSNFLVKNYYQKQNYVKRVVLVIESFKNVENLLVLLRNILGQEIKVDLIILISSDETLKQNRLIHDTCILNKVGGLSFLFKESGNDTILVFIFSEGFNVFSNPRFLKKFLETENNNINGLVKVESANVKADVNKMYS